MRPQNKKHNESQQQQYQRSTDTGRYELHVEIRHRIIFVFILGARIRL